MERGESLLDTIYEDDSLGNLQDVEMLDAEEGECVLENPPNPAVQNSSGGTNDANQESESRNHRRRKKKKNRRKNDALTPKVTDVNRFVLATCRRLKEKKSYMVYNAVGCLGVSALSDLVKEVDAIQSCGGQMTTDGRRHRTGGGILWSIIKTREPKAYKEIMKKAKEFEKQFRAQSLGQSTGQNNEASERNSHASTDHITISDSDGSQLMPQMQSHPAQSNIDCSGKRKPVHERIRIPVKYDDLLGGDPQDDAT